MPPLSTIVDRAGYRLKETVSYHRPPCAPSFEELSPAEDTRSAPPPKEVKKEPVFFDFRHASESTVAPDGKPVGKALAQFIYLSSDSGARLYPPVAGDGFEMDAQDKLNLQSFVQRMIKAPQNPEEDGCPQCGRHKWFTIGLGTPSRWHTSEHWHPLNPMLPPCLPRLFVWALARDRTIRYLQIAALCPCGTAKNYPSFPLESQPHHRQYDPLPPDRTPGHRPWIMALNSNMELFLCERAVAPEYSLRPLDSQVHRSSLPLFLPALSPLYLTLGALHNYLYRPIRPACLDNEQLALVVISRG